MNINKISIISSVIIIVLVITIPTCYQVVKEHQDHLYRAVESKMIEAAKRCYYEDVCKDDHITLAVLYEDKYLDKMSNPVTKEYYNEKSYILREGINFTFVKVE